MNSVIWLTDSPAMILVVYSGRKETKQQTTTTHTASVIRHMQAIRIRVTKRVNNVGYFRCSVMLKLHHNLQ